MQEPKPDRRRFKSHHPNHTNVLMAKTKLLIGQTTHQRVIATHKTIAQPVAEQIHARTQQFSIELLHGGIESVHTEAIVNAANSHLQHTGGISYAFLRAAAGDLQQQSDASVTADGPVSAGSCRVLGTLSAGTDIVHAVVPRFRRGKGSDELEAVYTATIDAILATAVRMGYTSIGIPLVGAGGFGWDIERAAELVVASIYKFAAANSKHSMHVVLFDLNVSAVEAYEAAMATASKVGPASDLAATSAPVPPYRPDNVWFWKEDAHHAQNGDPWMAYDYDQIVQIERARKQNENFVTLRGDRNGVLSISKHIPDGEAGAVYKIDLNRMIQTNIKSNHNRSIRFVPTTEDNLPEEYRTAEDIYMASSEHVCNSMLDQGTTNVDPHDNSFILLEGLATEVATVAQQLAVWYASKFTILEVPAGKLATSTLKQLLATPKVEQALKGMHASFNRWNEQTSCIEFEYYNQSASSELQLRTTIFEVLVMLMSQDRVPQEWVKRDGSPWTSSDDAKDSLVLVDVSAKELQFCQRRFKAGGMTVPLKRVQRVQNALLWRKYSRVGLNGDPNEKWLFHGTNRVDPQQLAKTTGIDFRHASEGGYFGRGSYFAERSTYSDGYAFATASNDKQMFLARVAAGKVDERGGNRDKNLKKPKPGHDSVHGLVAADDYAYVIYDLAQSYPEYLLTY